MSQYVINEKGYVIHDKNSNEVTGVFNSNIFAELYMDENCIEGTINEVDVVVSKIDQFHEPELDNPLEKLPKKLQ